MKPLLLGLAAPSIASTAGTVRRAVASVGKPLATSFASLLQTESQSTLPAESPSAGSLGLRLEDLDTHAKALQVDLESRIQRVIEDSGVQLRFPVRLRLSESEGVLEADTVGSPQREILEAALASVPRLADDFRQLAALRDLLSAAEKEEGFAEAYSRDPEQAIVTYGLASDNRFEALLRLSETDRQLHLEFDE